MQITERCPSSGPGEGAGFGEDCVGWIPATMPAFWTGALVQGSDCTGDHPEDERGQGTRQSPTARKWQHWNSKPALLTLELLTSAEERTMRSSEPSSLDWAVLGLALEVPTR